MESDIWIEYFDWLCLRVASDHTPKPVDYTFVLWRLHETEFTPTVWLDESRVMDALEFRKQFTEHEMEHPVGIFEMMVCLATRIERDRMGGTVSWDRSADWFWEMMQSLGLLRMTNRRYDQIETDAIIACFLKRRYSRNGSGGLFTTDDPTIDMRDRDIWKQAAAYLNEILRDEGVLE